MGNATQFPSKPFMNSDGHEHGRFDSLSRLRRRMVCQFFAERLVAYGLLFAAALVAMAGVNALRGIAPLDKWQLDSLVRHICLCNRMDMGKNSHP